MDVDDQCSAFSWTCYQHEQGLDELKQSLLTTSWELEMTVLSAKEELSIRERELIRINEVLNKTVKERDELELKCHTLQEQNNHLLLQKQNVTCISAAKAASSESTEETESNTSSISTSEQVSLPDSIKELIGNKTLPTKGKFLQAVMEAGPLLETILLAGPLPQWENQPPQLNFDDIPLVSISINPTKYTDQSLIDSNLPTKFQRTQH